MPGPNRHFHELQRGCFQLLMLLHLMKRLLRLPPAWPVEDPLGGSF